MTDPTIPTMGELVEVACAACAAAGYPAWRTWREEIAISLAAALPLVTAPAMEALGGIIDSLAEQDDEGLIEHAEPFRRARTIRDQLVAMTMMLESSLP